MTETNQIIYELCEDEQEAIRTVYNLLNVINCDASINDMIEINEDAEYYYKYEELQKVYENLKNLLEADSIILTKKHLEEGENI